VILHGEMLTCFRAKHDSLYSVSGDEGDVEFSGVCLRGLLKRDGKNRVVRLSFL